METKIKPIDSSQVNAVVEFALAHYGWPREFAPGVSMNDEYEWADGKSPIIMWEEGPHEFGYEFTQNEDAKKYLRELGYYMEAATSWAIVIYPLEGVVATASLGWCGNMRHPSESHEETAMCIGFIADDQP